MSSGSPPTWTTQLRVSACACAGSSRGQGGPMSTSTCQPPAVARASPVSGSTWSGPAGGAAGAIPASSCGLTGNPSFSIGTSPSWGQHRTKPAAHRGDRLGKSDRLILPCGPQQASDVDEITEYLTVVRRRSFVVAAIRQHLHLDLPAQPPDRHGEQRVVAEEDRETGQRLQVLDEMVAADVRLQAAAQETGVRGKLAAKRAFDRAAMDEVAVNPAERPGAERRRVRAPRRTPPGYDGRVPRLPYRGEHRLRVRAPVLTRKRPCPIPVVEVKTPKQRRVCRFPVRARPASDARFRRLRR